MKLNCYTDKAIAKMMKNHRTKQKKQDKTDATTKIRCNLVVNLGRNNILRPFESYRKCPIETQTHCKKAV
jgi:hypothetical protein